MLGKVSEDSFQDLLVDGSYYFSSERFAPLNVHRARLMEQQQELASTLENQSRFQNNKQSNNQKQNQTLSNKAVGSTNNSATNAQLAAQQAAANNKNVNTNRYKTELCRPFQENGVCKYGEKCQFAHGQAELRSVTRHPKYKTDLCRTFHSVGFCPYGPRCHFIHNLEELKESPKGSQQPAVPTGKSKTSQAAAPGMPPLPMFDNISLRLRNLSESDYPSSGSSTSSQSPSSNFGDLDFESESSFAHQSLNARLPVFSTLFK